MSPMHKSITALAASALLATVGFATAQSTDANGNVSRAVRSVWLAGDQDWWFGGDNGDRMDVVPEKQSYKAGETARFQVRMPFREAEALVTVEREGVLSSFTTELSGKDPVIEVKLDGSYAPDVFISVEAVRGRPLSERAQEVGFRIGLGLVLMLMVFATYNDILHLFAA